MHWFSFVVCLGMMIMDRAMANHKRKRCVNFLAGFSFDRVKPRCMHKGYGSCCVCVSVCYHYIPGLYYVQSEIAYSFS